MDNEERVRQGLEAAEAIVAMAEGALHGGEEVDEDKAEELVRRARAFSGPRPGSHRDAQRSLSNAAQALSDAARFERDRKRSRSPDGQKRNWLARNMALSTAKLNAAMAEMHLSSPAQQGTQEQLHELTDAVTDLSEGVHQTSAQVATGGVDEEDQDYPQPQSSAGSGGTIGTLPGGHRPRPHGGRPRRRRRGPGPGPSPGPGHFPRGGPPRRH